MSRSGFNSSSALDQVEKEKTIAGKVEKWNNQRNQASTKLPCKTTSKQQLSVMDGIQNQNLSLGASC